MHNNLLWVGILVVVGCTQILPVYGPIQVTAEVETAPVPSADDAADDPAIWIHPEEPGKSLVIGTDKRSGLLAYDLRGNQLQYLPVGQLNNIDLRHHPWGMQQMSLIAATQRGPSRIVLFTLDHTNLKVTPVAVHTTELQYPYGVCMYQDIRGVPHVIANSKDGAFVMYAVARDYSLTPVRRWHTASQPEGCVADDARQVVYFGEEEQGIWRLNLTPGSTGEVKLVDSVNSGRLTADVEGMALYFGDQQTLLVVSSQGDNSFAVYDTANDQYLYSFHVVSNKHIDGVTETDGLDIVSNPLPGFPRGLLVVQDDDNRQPRANQNFKLVSWSNVEQAADSQEAAN